MLDAEIKPFVRQNSGTLGQSHSIPPLRELVSRAAGSSASWKANTKTTSSFKTEYQGESRFSSPLCVHQSISLRTLAAETGRTTPLLCAGVCFPEGTDRYRAVRTCVKEIAALRTERKASERAFDAAFSVRCERPTNRQLQCKEQAIDRERLERRRML